jgi:hypothetical protein
MPLTHSLNPSIGDPESSFARIPEANNISASG